MCQTNTFNDYECGSSNIDLQGSVQEQAANQELLSSVDKQILEHWKIRCQIRITDLYFFAREHGLLTSKSGLPEVRFDVSSYKVLGYCRYPNIIFLNLHYLLKAKEEYVEQVVGHEFAHYIVYQHMLHKLIPKDTPGHGSYWKSIMIKLGLPPETYYKGELLQPEDLRSSTQLPPLRKPQKKYIYNCECDTTHYFSGIRHNRTQTRGRRKVIYLCKKCDKPCVYTGRTTED